MSTRTKPILFYGTRDEYGCFSNFWPSPLRLKGRTWPTVEHYFQAQKFPDTEHAEAIRQAKSPAKAKSLGRSRRVRLRRDWEQVKGAVMREAVLAKFTQHPDLAAVLLSTDDAAIAEHTRNDAYWGDGGDGHGKNKLGKILMSVREELRAGPAPVPREAVSVPGEGVVAPGGSGGHRTPAARRRARTVNDRLQAGDAGRVPEGAG